MSHTKEPWNFDTYDGITHITDSNNNLAIARLTSYGGVYGASESNARRIVACINACAGKKTEDLEAMAGKDIFTGNIFSKRVAMEKERDQLRELCGELLTHLKNAYQMPSVERDYLLESSITKAEAILGEKNGR